MVNTLISSWIAATALAWVLILFNPVHAAVVPETINYQGYLTNASDQPVNGTESITFKIYSVESGVGPALWEQTKSVEIKDGKFSIELGDGIDPFPPGLFNGPLYLGITVGSDAEMTPRKPLTSAPFAISAGDATTLQGETLKNILYEDADARAAMGPKSPTNPLNHDRYTDADAVAAMGSTVDSNSLNHDRYSNTEAVIAMGARANTNPLNHDRYIDSEAVAAVKAADGAGSGLDADRLDGIDSTGFARASEGVRSFADGNTAVGKFTLTKNTTGKFNTASGERALNDNTEGNYNTASGKDALHNNTTGYSNTASGFQALLFNTTGNSNTANGANALSLNTTGIDNTANGRSALYNNDTGNFNTASGTSALYSNTIGNSNTASGERALQDNTTGNNNTATGSRALLFNITGNRNTAIGSNALYYNTAGYSNAANGAFALRWNTTGYNNTASGDAALRDNTTGYNNTASGNWALVNNTTGIGNTAIGFRAGYLYTTGDDNIAIGHFGVAAESSTTRIGSAQTRAFIAGIRGVTTGIADAVSVVVDSNGQLGTVSSSRRYKEDISNMAGVSEQLLSLRPVTFRYKQAFKDGTKPVQYGLIAEEVAEVFPDLVVNNEAGEPETVKYRLLTTLLLNELQKQASELDLMKKQSSQMQELEAQVQELRLLTMQLAKDQGIESGIEMASTVNRY